MSQQDNLSHSHVDASQSIATNKKSNSSKTMLGKKNDAAIKIQKVVRGYLERKNNAVRDKSFRNRSHDPNEKLKIMER